MKIGIDLVEVKRIEKSIENPRFLKKVFSEDELKIFVNKKNVQTIAGRFCVKEAFAKALGTGVRGFALNEISTLNDELGCPYIVTTGRANEILNQRKVSVSISHTKEYATAAVIIYNSDKKEEIE